MGGKGVSDTGFGSRNRWRQPTSPDPVYAMAVPEKLSAIGSASCGYCPVPERRPDGRACRYSPTAPGRLPANRVDRFRLLLSSADDCKSGNNDRSSARLARPAIIEAVLPSLHERGLPFRPLRRSAGCVLRTFAAGAKAALVFRWEAGKIDGICHLRRIVGAGAQERGCASMQDCAQQQYGDSHVGGLRVGCVCVPGTQHYQLTKQTACPVRSWRRTRFSCLPP